MVRNVVLIAGSETGSMILGCVDDEIAEGSTTRSDIGRDRDDGSMPDCGNDVSRADASVGTWESADFRYGESGLSGGVGKIEATSAAISLVMLVFEGC